jgi:hypothetical protein
VLDRPACNAGGHIGTWVPAGPLFGSRLLFVLIDPGGVCKCTESLLYVTSRVLM